MPAPSHNGNLAEFLAPDLIAEDIPPLFPLLTGVASENGK
jgi:hypothetical protein